MLADRTLAGDFLAPPISIENTRHNDDRKRERTFESRAIYLIHVYVRTSEEQNSVTTCQHVMHEHVFILVIYEQILISRIVNNICWHLFII